MRFPSVTASYGIHPRQEESDEGFKAAVVDLIFGREISIIRHSVMEDVMKRVILAVSLLLPLFFSVASAQLTKMTVGYGAIAAGHLPA